MYHLLVFKYQSLDNEWWLNQKYNTYNFILKINMAIPKPRDKPNTFSIK